MNSQPQRYGTHIAQPFVVPSRHFENTDCGTSEAMDSKSIQVDVCTSRPRRRNHICEMTIAVFVIAAAFRVPLASAQSLPTGWTATQIGSPTPSGNASQTNGVYTVFGGGADIW